MSGARCVQCGLINFGNDKTCKRCRGENLIAVCDLSSNVLAHARTPSPIANTSRLEQVSKVITLLVICGVIGIFVYGFFDSFSQSSSTSLTEYDRQLRAREEEERAAARLDAKCEETSKKLQCELCTLTEQEKEIGRQCLLKKLKSEYPNLSVPQGTQSEADQPRPESEKARLLRQQLERDNEYWRKEAEKRDAEERRKKEKERAEEQEKLRREQSEMLQTLNDLHNH